MDGRYLKRHRPDSSGSITGTVFAWNLTEDSWKTLSRDDLLTVLINSGGANARARNVSKCERGVEEAPDHCHSYNWPNLHYQGGSVYIDGIEQHPCT